MFSEQDFNIHYWCTASLILWRRQNRSYNTHFIGKALSSDHRISIRSYSRKWYLRFKMHSSKISSLSFHHIYYYIIWFKYSLLKKVKIKEWKFITKKTSFFILNVTCNWRCYGSQDKNSNMPLVTGQWQLQQKHFQWADEKVRNWTQGVQTRHALIHSSIIPSFFTKTHSEELLLPALNEEF
jgi:hypothetical protein